MAIDDKLVTLGDLKTVIDNTHDSTKQDTLTFDATPTQGSTNPVTSGGIYTGLDGKVDKENGKGLSTNDFTDADKQKLSELSQYVGAGIIFDTASGSIASFSDGGDGLPVKSVSVDVDPVQDLHGYDKPWAGGAGKNLLDLKDASYTTNGITVVVKDGVAVVNGTATANALFALQKNTNTKLIGGTEYILNGAPSANVYLQQNYIPVGSSTQTGATDRGSGAAFTPNDSSSYTTYLIVTSGYTANNIIVKPMIRLASVSDATFEPYSNVCPITGHTSATITRVGKNLLPMTVDGIKAANGGASSWSENSKTINGVTFTINTDSSGNVTGIKVNGTATVGISFHLNSYVNLANANYVLSSGSTNLPSGVLLAVQTSDGNKEIANAYQRDISASITGLAWIYITSGRTVDTTIQPMIRFASDPAGFELYQGHVYNVTFPDAAGTVYGGTLDLNAGRLTVDCVTKTFLWSEFDGSSELGDYRRRTKTGLSPVPFGSSTKNISNVAMHLANWEDRSNHFYIDSNSKVLVMVLHKNTPESTEIQVCYELVTPITYSLTAEEITTLLGINHVWADTGDVSVEYAADPKLYINKVIANALNA